MNQELNDHELDQANGASINPSPSVISPTGTFRWRLRATSPTEG